MLTLGLIVVTILLILFGQPLFVIIGAIAAYCFHFYAGESLEVMVDWKTNESINLAGYGKMLEPFDHLEDCNFTHYVLQLNLYRQIL